MGNSDDETSSLVRAPFNQPENPPACIHPPTPPPKQIRVPRTAN